MGSPLDLVPFRKVIAAFCILWQGHRLYRVRIYVDLHFWSGPSLETRLFSQVFTDKVHYMKKKYQSYRLLRGTNICAGHLSLLVLAQSQVTREKCHTQTESLCQVNVLLEGHKGPLAGHVNPRSLVKSTVKSSCQVSVLYPADRALQRLVPHVNATCTIFSMKLLYITTQCLIRTLPCVDFMDVIMGDIPLFLHVNTAYTIFTIKLPYIT